MTNPDLTQTLTAAKTAAQATAYSPPAVLSRRLYDQITARLVELEHLERLALAELSTHAAWAAHLDTGYGPDGSFAWHDERHRLFCAWDEAQKALHAALEERPAGGTND